MKQEKMDGIDVELDSVNYKKSDIISKVSLYIIFFLQGLGTVLPWNVLITASDFFKYIYTGSNYNNNFQNYFSVIFMAVQLIFLVPAIVTQRKGFLFNRILINLITTSVLFAFLLTFPFLNLGPNTMFGLTMIPLILYGVAGVFAITDVYGLASIFPPIYIQGVMSGQAIGGVAVALFQLIISYTGLNNPNVSPDSVIERGKVYFGVALTISIINIISLLLLPKVSIYQHYYLKGSNEEGTMALNKSSLRTKLKAMSIAFKKVWILAISVMLVFLVTLSIFPSITAAIKTSQPDSSLVYKSLFVSIHFVVYNVGDLVGRLILGVNILRPKRSYIILLLSLLRFIFFFLFLTNNIDLGNEVLNSKLYHLFNNDSLYFFFIFIFAVSSGYLGSGSMVLAPSLVENPELISHVGNVMAFSLTMGLALGSFLSFGLRATICQCNSFME
ncbi:hypothetical protein K502DRAFT_366318 [Neoconidiobolus thromboides FSU 785]|nr:hypothetical protein K502DRAFT_366318 [Neoconidiobolus thromboides FSU 785]